MTNEQNKIYQTKLKEANELLYKLVEGLQTEGRSLREIGKLLSISRRDVITILKKEVGELSYDAVLRLQSSILANESKNSKTDS